MPSLSRCATRHVDHDLAIPADKQFIEATWEIPRGTSMGCDPFLDMATKLRVTMPNGIRYRIQIDHEGGGGDDGTRPCTYFVVRTGPTTS